jgi:hypothetical protein
MADASAKWAFNTEADFGQTDAMAGSLEELRKNLLLAESSLKTIDSTMRTYKGTSLGTKEEMGKLKTAQLAGKEVLAKAHKEFLAAGGDLKNKFRPQVKGATLDSKELTNALIKSIPGASRVMSALQGVSLSAVGIAAGSVLAVAAVVALAVGLGVATVAGYKFALAQADMARSQRIAIEQGLIYDQMIGRLRGIKDVTAYTEDYDQAISRVARNVPVARGEVAKTFAELQKFRLTGDTLEKAARASLLVGGVDRFMALGYSAKMAGTSIGKTAELIEKKFGDSNKRAMMSLSVQVMKLKESFLGMFRTLHIESILGMFQKFADLFSENTVLGQGLKTIVEGLFKPLETFASGPIGGIVKAVFGGLVIAALLATDAILTLADWLEDTFGSDKIGKIDELQVALWVAEGALTACAIAAIALGGAMALIVLSAAILAAPFYALYKVIEEIESLDLSPLGKNLMLGFLNGITGGVSGVIQTIKKLGGTVKAALAESLGIHSKSRFGIYAGQMLGEGLSFGVKSRRPEVEMATGGLARAAAGGAATASAAPRASGAVMHIQSLIGQLVYQGNPDDSGDLERKVEDALSTALERLAIEQGVTFQLGGG